MASKIVGIDLGTTNSLVAFVEHEGGLQTGIPRVLPGADGKHLLPSAVTFENGEVVAIGYPALERRARDPRTTVTSVKRFMGRAPADLVAAERQSIPYEIVDDLQVIRLRVGGKEITPPEVSALILTELRKRAEAALGEPIQQAVVTVPAYFDDGQRQATKDAGRLAGLDIVRLVNEPTAASLAYGLQQRTQGIIAVYDLGGGTFDISILKVQDGVFEVLATGGNTQLGGDDWDRRLAEHVQKQLRAGTTTLAELKHDAEVAKVALSSSERPSCAG